MTEAHEPSPTGPASAPARLRTVVLVSRWGAVLEAVLLLIGVITRNRALVLTGLGLLVVTGIVLFLLTFLSMRSSARRNRAARR